MLLFEWALLLPNVDFLSDHFLSTWVDFCFLFVIDSCQIIHVPISFAFPNSDFQKMHVMSYSFFSPQFGIGTCIQIDHTFSH